MNRRQFLAGVGRSSLLLGAMPLATGPEQDNQSSLPVRIRVPGAKALLDSPLVQYHFRAGTGPFWVAGRFLNAFVAQSARYLDYDQLDPSWHRKYQLAGNEPKSYVEARSLWEKVPAAVRARGPEALRQFHRGKDWSHIIPRAMGGPTTAENGLWWSSGRNRRLGPYPMSPGQILQAKSVLVFEGTASALLSSLQPMLRGGMTGAVLGAVFAVLDYGLQYAEGHITREELYRAVIAATVRTGVGALIIAGLITGMAIAFPSVLPVLVHVSGALAVVGFVYLAVYLKDLGEDWWSYLDEQDVLAEFLEGLAMTEAILSALAQEQSGHRGREGASRPWGPFPAADTLVDRLSAFLAELDMEAYLSDFNYARYFPDMELDRVLRQIDLDLQVPEHLAVLDVNIRELLSQLDLSFRESNLLADLRQGTAAAQDALKRASAYLHARPADRP